MTSYWYDQLAAFMGGILVLVTTLGLWEAIILPCVDRWNRRFFIAFFVVLELVFLSGISDLMVYRDSDRALAERIFCFMGYLFNSFLYVQITVFLLHWCGVDQKNGPLMRGVLALEAVYLALLAANQFHGWFFYVTADNQFHRGPWHPALFMPLIGILLIGLFSMLRWRSRMPRKYFFTALIYMSCQILATLLHAFIFVPLVIFLAIALCALLMFGIIVQDQVEQYLRQQREIARQRASIMVLQMRPHFIHNTMTSIYYLCEQDPKKAQQVTRDFNTYLRKNFTAIASADTIPFTEELEHTRAYLAVEQAQFEDSLFVDYDTPHIRFRVPPLTLQPIVENAIKHGMDPDAEPLRVTIRTRATDFGSAIIVEDNGSGFEPAHDDAPHTALSNIRQRLKLMCGGGLTIQPREGGGTVVTVMIP